MKVVLVLNGTPPSAGLLRTFAAEARLFAADGGALACRAAGLCPEMLVGDFDSVAVDMLPSDWVSVKDGDENFTDFEKLLRRLPEEMSSLVILGGLGRRMDHAWNNFVVAAGVREDMPVYFAGEEETVHRVTRLCPLHLPLEPGVPVSLLPMGIVRGVSTTGFCWDVAVAVLGPGAGISQSNEAVGPVTLRVSEGVLFVWTGTRVA